MIGQRHGGRGGGFTLIELLIVIGILVILIALAVAVGSSVVSGGRKAKTTDVIRVLDTLLNDYTATFGTIPSPTYADPSAPAVLIPVVDGRNMDASVGGLTPPGFQMVNSVGLFIQQVEASGSASEAIRGLDAALIGRAARFHPAQGQAVEVPTVFDAWGRPIRYVHPSLHGRLWAPLDNPNRNNQTGAVPVNDVLGPAPTGTRYAFENIRRNMARTSAGGDPQVAHEFADSDGGYCPSQRPYFYSAGEDGDPSTTDDNVYAVQPRFPAT